VNFQLLMHNVMDTTNAWLWRHWCTCEIVWFRIPHDINNFAKNRMITTGSCYKPSDEKPGS